MDGNLYYSALDRISDLIVDDQYLRALMLPLSGRHFSKFSDRTSSLLMQEQENVELSETSFFITPIGHITARITWTKGASLLDQS